MRLAVLLISMIVIPVDLLQADGPQDRQESLSQEDVNQLLRLLADPIVAKEVGFEPEHLRAARRGQLANAIDSMAKLSAVSREMHSEIVGGPLNNERIAEFAVHMKAISTEAIADGVDLIDEILTPQQKERLQQIQVRAEIRRFGFAYALVQGRFGDKVGVYEGQKDTLVRKVKKIEEAAMKEIEAINKRTEERVLAELVPEQRIRAKEILGPSIFHWPIWSIEAAIRQNHKLTEK